MFCTRRRTRTAAPATRAAHRLKHGRLGRRHRSPPHGKGRRQRRGCEYFLVPDWRRGCVDAAQPHHRPRRRRHCALGCRWRCLQPGVSLRRPGRERWALAPGANVGPWLQVRRMVAPRGLHRRVCPQPCFWRREFPGQTPCQIRGIEARTDSWCWRCVYGPGRLVRAYLLLQQRAPGIVECKLNLVSPPAFPTEQRPSGDSERQERNRGSRNSRASTQAHQVSHTSNPPETTQTPSPEQACDVNCARETTVAHSDRCSQTHQPSDAATPPPCPCAKMRGG